MKSLSAVTVAFLTIVLSCAAQAPTPTAVDVAAKIKALSDQQLVDCLKEKASNLHLFAAIHPNTSHDCLLEESDRDVAIIEGELSDRKHPDLLIAAYKETYDGDQRQNLVKALYQIDDPTVVAFMGSVAFEFLPTAEAFAALEYLAQRCHEPALERLDLSLPLGSRAAMQCVEWGSITETFGRCDYRAAAPKLVLALRAPCSNLIDAAEEDLQRFFPGACQQAHSKAEEASCFQKLVQNDAAQSK
jgi:hypothetical protein